MVFSRWFSKNETPVLRQDGLILRAPTLADYGEWRAVRLESRKFLKPFEPRWSEADLSQRVFRNRLRRGLKESVGGTEFSFFIFADAAGKERLIGGVTLSNIRRRVAQQVNLGYWMGVNDAKKGVMSRAVAMVLPFVFDEQSLNRIHAACLPDNQASRRVLEKNNFQEEGFAESYLQIDGEWRDHVLYGLTKERFIQNSG